MLYSEVDRTMVKAELAKRRFRVITPTVVLVAFAIASFVWFRLHHNADGWVVTGLISLLGGAYFLFFYEVYQRPVALYKKHLDFMLDARKRETVGLLTSVNREVCDKNGLDCISFTVNVGEKNDPEDDRLFYLDVLRPMPDWPLGTRVCVFSNDRMVAGLDMAPKES